MDTCKTCRNFSLEEKSHEFGSCLLMGDANHFVFYLQNHENKASSDRCYGWDFESYMAGVYVGKDFGCIHWEKLNGSDNS